MNEHLTRPGALAWLGGLMGVTLTGWRTAPARAASCVLTSELTEGPYYLPNEPLRRNITGRRPGAPLELRLGVVDASTCRPIKGALVDIWHADAGGVYSGVAGNSGTFLRGLQRTGAAGLATFQT